MPLFRFLDMKRRGPCFVMHAFGVAFPAGVAVEVTDDAVVAKLRGNRFFEEADADDSSAPLAADAPERRPRGRPRKV